MFWRVETLLCRHRKSDKLDPCQVTSEKREIEGRSALRKNKLAFASREPSRARPSISAQTNSASCLTYRFQENYQNIMDHVLCSRVGRLPNCA